MSVRGKQLCVQSGQGNYNVDFFPDLESLCATVNTMENGFLIVDPVVYKLHADFFARLKKFPVHLAPALESEKTLAGVERFLEFLQHHNATKSATILAVGGGIIQDIATFAAHLYYRGLPLIYLPTTLLSMADSCIGAKCGINFNTFKNQLGFFHAPSRVMLAEAFLTTLSDYDLRSGYGEIVKLFLLDGASSFLLLEKIIQKHGFRNAALSELIYKSLEIKKNVIEEDEYELDLRRILNYGHTFCHALETLTEHAIPHGWAVAWGVDLANYVSMKKGLLLESHYRMIHQFIASFFHTDLKVSYGASELIQGMKRDKKTMAGKVSLILLKEPGQPQITPTYLDEELQEIIHDYLLSENIFASR